MMAIEARLSRAEKKTTGQAALQTNCATRAARSPPELAAGSVRTGKRAVPTLVCSAGRSPLEPGGPRSLPPQQQRPTPRRPAPAPGSTEKPGQLARNQIHGEAISQWGGRGRWPRLSIDNENVEGG